MSGVWIMIVSLAVATAVLKLLGPLLLGGRTLPAEVMSVIELMASALLAALVVVETFGNGRSLTLDSRALGVVFAALAMARRAPLMVAVVGAAVVTALARAVA